MPFYEFVDKDTGEESSGIMSWDELQQHLSENPNLRQKLATPGFADPHRMGRIKPDDSFRDLLKETKKAHKGSTVNTY